MNIQDFKKQFSLIDYVSENYQIEPNGDSVLMRCPFHIEETPSCLIKDDRFTCYGAGCGEHGDSIDFLMKTLGISYGDVLSMNFGYTQPVEQKRKTVPVKREISLPPVSRYIKELLKTEYIKRYLLDRYITAEAMVKYSIGYMKNVTTVFSSFTQPRIVIPVYNDNGLTNARYRIDPRYNGEPKYLGHPGRKPFLFNYNIIQQSKNIVIAGSELDAIALTENGIPSVGVPGEGVFFDDWMSYFWDKNILIWFDYDVAGLNAMLQLYRRIKFHAKKTLIFEWPNIFEEKDDIKDFIDAFGITKTKEVVHELFAS